MSGLEEVLAGLAPPFAFAGIGIAVAGRDPEFALQAAPGIGPVSPDTHWRAASISKIVVGQVARLVFDLAPETDAAELLGWPFRHPDHPDVPITVRMLAGHLSGLVDDGGYVVAPGTSLERHVRELGPAAWGARPGNTFAYSNLGYLVLAALCEDRTGERFDRLARRLVLEPLGLTGGFNWSGVPAEVRGAALPTYRRAAHGAFEPQIDSVISPAGVSGPDGREIAAGYRIGKDTALMSPPGGLRLSMAGALRLAASLGREPFQPIHVPEKAENGVLDVYGWGVQHIRAPGFYPRPIIGHFANAYGFSGGVWYDAERDAAFVIALNGRALGDDSDDLHPSEATLFAAVADHLG